MDETTRSWVQAGATVLSGLVISAVLTYFQADRFKAAADRAAVRCWRFAKDHPVLVFWIPVLVAGLAITEADLTKAVPLAWPAAWSVALALVSFQRRNRGCSLAVFEAGAGGKQGVELVDFKDGSISRASCGDDVPVVAVRADRPDENYVYFRVADPIVSRFRRSDSSLMIVETWADRAWASPADVPFHIDVGRDTEIQFKSVAPSGAIGEFPWRLILFHAYRVEYRRRQQGRADFRLDIRRDTDLFVRTVTVATFPH